MEQKGVNNNLKFSVITEVKTYLVLIVFEEIKKGENIFFFVLASPKADWRLTDGFDSRYFWEVCCPQMKKKRRNDESMVILVSKIP